VASLLFSQFLASRLLSTAFLGGAYVVGGAGVLAYLVTFPGVFGTTFAPQAAPLLWVWWHCTFPLAVIVALYFDREKKYTREKHTARLWVGGVAPVRGEGAGIVYDKRGDILTDQHVVSGANSIMVTFPSGRKAPAKLVGSDTGADLAVQRHLRQQQSAPVS